MEWCCEMDFIWDIHKSSKHSSFIYIQVPKHDTLVSLVKISVTYRLEFMQTLRRWFVNKKEVTKYKKIVVVNIFWELTTCSSRCDFKLDIWYLLKISALHFEDESHYENIWKWTGGSASFWAIGDDIKMTNSTPFDFLIDCFIAFSCSGVVREENEFPTCFNNSFYVRNVFDNSYQHFINWET